MPETTTLIIEDGTIVAGADSYIGLSASTAYHAARGNSAWAALTDAQKEEALRKACAYLDGHYYSQWKGAQVNPITQNLQWPRAGVKVSQDQIYFNVPPSYYDSEYSGFLDITTIPQRLKDAQCELALRSLSGDLAEDLDRGGKVTSVTVGPISQTFSSSAPADKKYSLVDKLLTPLLKAKTSAIVRS